MTTGGEARDEVTPTSRLAVLEPWIRARLHPLSDYDAGARTLRSDYDLNPGTDRPPTAGPLHPAAVLVPLVEREEGLAVLLTRRADTLTRHSGQVAFPGGRAEPSEPPWETALREAEEEIGLDRAWVRVAGLADPYETITSFTVTPVVAFVRPGFELRPAAAEVAEVFETPFAYLMDPANHERRFHEAMDGTRRHYFAMPYDDRLIWGATAGMLHSLYERLFGSLSTSQPT